MRAARNIFHLGIKELRSLLRDPILMFFIIWGSTLNIYTAATAMPETLHKAPIAIVDEDKSGLSARIVDAFYPPYFLRPAQISMAEMDRRMDAGIDTFALVIPSGFQRDVFAGRNPALQLNVDATQMSQAFTGSNHIKEIVSGEINDFIRHNRTRATPPVDLVLRARFNPQLNKVWFAAPMEVVTMITAMAVVLTGAALIREREHGTVEHLLVMPVTPFEIMSSKLWAMSLVALLSAAFSLAFVVRGFLEVPTQGSVILFFAGATLHLFAATSLGIFLATIARSMPQFGLLLFMVLLPMQILSGLGGMIRAQALSSGVAPHEGVAGVIQVIMLAAPTTHFVKFAQAVLFRGAGLSVVWPQLAALAVITAILFSFSLLRFRKTLATMADV